MSKNEKLGSCIDCGEKIYEKSVRCRRCSNKESKRRYLDQNLFDALTNLTEYYGLYISTERMTAYESTNGRIISISSKRKFMFPCVICSRAYETLLARERKKIYKWHCQSCVTSLLWKSNDYHKKHVEAIVAIKSTPESIARHSLATKKKWSNPEYRSKTLNSLRNTWNSSEYKSKLSASLKLRWKNNPPNCTSRRYVIQTHDGVVTVKSTYERDFVRLLESRGYSWEYEAKTFLLKSFDGRVLIPDFYVKDLDLVVEIKGYFWNDAQEKWNAFVQEYPDIKKIILFKDDLKLLISGEKTLEDHLEKTCG